MRNRLLLNALHFSVYFWAVSFVKLFVEIGKLFLINDYVSIQIHILAILDYLSFDYLAGRGEPDRLHQRILAKLPKFDRKLGASHSQKITHGMSKSDILSSRFAYLGLSLHLLRYLFRGPKEEKLIYLQGQYDLTRSAKKIEIINPYDETTTCMTHSYERVWSLLGQLMSLLWKTLIFGSNAKKRYKKALEADKWMGMV